MRQRPPSEGHTLQVGPTGYLYLVYAALPLMLEQGRGAVVCSSSAAGTIGEVGINVIRSFVLGLPST